MLAIEKSEAGKLFEGANFTVVKKVGKAGEIVGKHNHPDKIIVFTVITGKVEVLLADTERHLLDAGSVLSFDGETYLQPTFLEDGAFVVVLIDK